MLVENIHTYFASFPLITELSKLVYLSLAKHRERMQIFMFGFFVSTVDFANRCSKSYRIKDEIIRQLLNGKRVVCSGQFRPIGEKVSFELDNAVFSSKTVKQGYRNLFVNGVSVDDMIQNRRNQWYLERKQKEAQERVERFARGRRM